MGQQQQQQTRWRQQQLQQLQPQHMPVLYPQTTQMQMLVGLQMATVAAAAVAATTQVQQQVAVVATPAVATSLAAHGCQVLLSMLLHLSVLL
jgi:hypothetical protein